MQATYRIINGSQVKTFATLPAAMRYQDRKGGILEFLGSQGWYSVK